MNELSDLKPLAFAVALSDAAPCSYVGCLGGGNKANPDPSKEVKWGDQTWEEMMIGFWSSVAERPAAATTQQ